MSVPDSTSLSSPGGNGGNTGGGGGAGGSDLAGDRARLHAKATELCYDVATVRGTWHFDLIDSYIIKL